MSIELNNNEIEILRIKVDSLLATATNLQAWLDVTFGDMIVSDDKET